MKKIINWKTSLCGWIGVIAIAVEPCLSDQWKPVAAKTGELAGVLAALFAADARKSGSTDAGKASQSTDSADGAAAPPAGNE